ncbi:cytochrome P450 [Acrocarpospora macrocephala]|uniref:Cytochrome P450 n=1 Tax=Acrocarpospora macrocephala TaxID=150177 RepID=A0A5M3WSW5_9ACTN|nr:cytochrome P450 [Acrocarpospora macrocephala]GES11282.1 cytochrome P450 [Acrocarpospora macrocephala]
MQIHANEHPLTTDKDISSRAFWAQPFAEREKTFAWLRRNAPVSWHAPIEVPGLPRDVHRQAGFWAVVRAKDITFVSENHDLFSSALGTATVRPMDETLRQPPTFLHMDPPEHTAYRKVMSAAFTPKAVAKLSRKIEERAREIIDRVAGAGEFDFVAEVSCKLPMLTVADLLGVPPDLAEDFARAGDEVITIGAAPEELPPGVSYQEYAAERMRFLFALGAELAAHRRKHPADDIMTSLVQAEFDGRKLTDQDISSMMMLLSVAGNDTTKQTTSQTVIQLDRHPDQRAWLMEDFSGRIAGAIEEFVRHASPVIAFARTAGTDLELDGVPIQAGDKVVIFYASGNRDETVFENPERFDLARGRSPHVGFGGGGVHYCLGNGVAKAQLRALFQEILTKLPNLEVGEPEYLPSEFINGVRRLPVRVS